MVPHGPKWWSKAPDAAEGVVHRRARCPTECPCVPAQNAGVDRHCDSEDQSQCGIRLRARKSESARQPQDAGSCSRKHTFGKTRSRKSITSNPFHLSSIFRTPQTSSLRMHSIALCCARRPDLEDLLHQLAWVEHSTTALLDMSVGTRRTK